MTHSTADLLRVFGRIGLLSFGGPAAQIALMHQELVEDRGWLSEAEFLRALSFCMLLPGPEAMQLATYTGWKRRGIVGGLIGGGLFVLPGAVVIALLASLYVTIGELPWVQALFVGIKATVVVIVIQALIKVAKRALTTRRNIGIAVTAFIALFAFAVPFPIVIFSAAILGAFGAMPVADTVKTTMNWGRSAAIIGAGTLLWAAPFAVIHAYDASFMRDIGVFFSTLAIVSFGGAYAVLAYMTQEVVSGFGWLTTAQIIDALGLAETTPGPLILVTQFVGMLAGYAQGGLMPAALAGLLTLWVTFVPCFIWIFAGAPLIAWLAGRPRLSAAMASITAAIVGVIANLSLWFALHVFFDQLIQIDDGPLRMIMPTFGSIQPLPLIIAGIAAVLLVWRSYKLLPVLGICAVIGLLAGLAGLPL